MQTNLKCAGQTAGRQLTRGRPRSQTGATGGEPIHVLFFVAFFNTLQHFLFFFVFFSFLQMLPFQTFGQVLSQLTGCQIFWGKFCLLAIGGRLELLDFFLQRILSLV